MDEGSEQEVSNGTAQTDTPEVRQNHIRRLQEGKEGPLTQRLFLFFSSAQKAVSFMETKLFRR